MKTSHSNYRKIIAIADDFSGAAEIAGLGHSYGLKVEIQEQFKYNPNLDLHVIDTNSRSLTSYEASNVSSSLAKQISLACPEAFIYKKVDSLFRGYICQEIHAIQRIFNFQRIFVLPNNPETGRRISNGSYFINQTKLSQSNLASDPDFPRESSEIIDLFPWKYKLPYKHLALKDLNLENKTIYTADINNLQDLEKRIQIIKPNDLLCGSGETFEAFLKILGVLKKTKKSAIVKCEFTVLINGSTHINEKERNIIDFNHVAKYYYPSDSDNSAKLDLEILRKLSLEKKIALYANPNAKNKDSILEGLAKLSKVLIDAQPDHSFHFLLTGGATANAILSENAFAPFHIVNQEADGVVSLRDINNQILLFTVKPGSYSWGEQSLNAF